jgi:hypothetical protein
MIMPILYARLRWGDRQPASSQQHWRDFNCTLSDRPQKSAEQACLPLTQQLRQVESNYALQRRLFL